MELQQNSNCEDFNDWSFPTTVDLARITPTTFRLARVTFEESAYDHQIAVPRTCEFIENHAGSLDSDFELLSSFYAPCLWGFQSNVRVANPPIDQEPAEVLTRALVSKGKRILHSRTARTPHGRVADILCIHSETPARVSRNRIGIDGPNLYWIEASVLAAEYAAASAADLLAVTESLRLLHPQAAYANARQLTFSGGLVHHLDVPADWNPKLIRDDERLFELVLSNPCSSPYQVEILVYLDSCVTDITAAPHNAAFQLRRIGDVQLVGPAQWRHGATPGYDYLESAYLVATSLDNMVCLAQHFPTARGPLTTSLVVAPQNKRSMEWTKTYRTFEVIRNSIVMG